MAVRANVTLTDAAGTPVNHVFKPTQVGSDGIIGWRDSNQSIYAGQAVLTCSQRLASRNAKATKVAWKLQTPVLEVTSPSTSSGIQPAPTVAYTPIATLEFVMPDRASQQERKDLLAMLRDLIDEAIVTSQVHDLEMIW
jgi:hypothetical protein